MATALARSRNPWDFRYVGKDWKVEFVSVETSPIGLVSFNELEELIRDSGRPTWADDGRSAKRSSMS
jgi:hypothetical protein